jgi:hypothetical protein
MTGDVSPDLLRALNAALGAYGSREPRWRYFEAGGQHGVKCFWTVERYDDDAGHEHAGLYVSGVYVPVGPGSRSGKATRFELAEDSVSGHRLRKDAKARALRLHRALKAGERRPWA